MECKPPKTTQELLEQLGGPPAAVSEMPQQVVDSPGSEPYLGDTPAHDVTTSLGAKQLNEWIAQTAQQFGVDDTGLGRMLVAQMALVHSKIGRLMNRHDVTESAPLMVPWAGVVTKLMAEFRRGYITLSKLQGSRERKRRRESRKPLATVNGKSRKKRARSFIERQQLNAAN